MCRCPHLFGFRRRPDPGISEYAVVSGCGFRLDIIREEEGWRVQSAREIIYIDAK